MFGYIEPDKSQLRLWEYERYRAVYCGLCRSMGKHTGCLSRLSLNYDYVFLAMIRSALEGAEPKFEPSRCMLHPTKKRAMAIDDKVLEYCADVSAMLTYHKVRDNIADCRGAKRLAFMALAPVCKGIYKRADSTEELGDKVAELLSEMSELEKSADATPDMLADVFGRIMSEIFTHGLDSPAQKRIAVEIGFHTGRYIYLADALDDAERDMKSGEFNPFVKQYGEAGLSDIAEKIKNAITETGTNYGAHYYRITLTGKRRNERIIEKEELLARLSPLVAFIKIKDKTKAGIDPYALAREKSLKGYFAALMLEKIEKAEKEDEKEKYINALEIGLRAFSEEVGYSED